MISLGFRNKHNKIKYIDIQVDNTDISATWISMLGQLLKKRHLVFQKNFSLLGIPNNNRTINNIVSDLLESVDIINKNTGFIIAEDFSALQNVYDQNLLNKLHYYFESAQGQLWNPSSVMLNANGSVRRAICYLNHCCHEIEAYYDSIKKNNLDKNCYFYYNLLGVTDRIEIPNSWKNKFVTEMSNGMVYLHYAQTGKTWYEAYLDNDNDVTLENITEHRIITGEFNIYFGPGFSLPRDENFILWLESKGVNPNDETLALGFAPVGKVIKITNEEAKNFFIEYNDFYSIRFNNIEQVYDYRFSDRDFKFKLDQLWHKWEKN